MQIPAPAHRRRTPGGLPAVVGAVDGRDPGADAVRRRRRAATSTVRRLPGRVPRRARSSSSIAAPATSRIKINNIAEGGGLIGIIGLIAPGDPFEGGSTAASPITIPGYMVSQAERESDPQRMPTGRPLRPGGRHPARQARWSARRPVARSTRARADQARDRRARRFGLGGRRVRHR